MYSGTSFTKFSGRILGAHQKIDSVARRHLTKLTKNESPFPPIRQILYFEGKHGPDAIKRKSPGRDEPWHFYSPFDDEDSKIFKLISEHYRQLIGELKKGNQERAAFEAAWLAHALVDGMTPAHHYPYEKTLEALRGEPMSTRTTYKDKLFIPGDTKREVMKKNWKVWGPRGLFTTHHLFEFGIATILKPLSFGEAIPTTAEVERFMEIGLSEWFKRTAREIAVLDMYGVYYRKGWTPKLAYQVRHKLGPALVQTVTLAWYAAMREANLVKLQK